MVGKRAEVASLTRVEKGMTMLMMKMMKLMSIYLIKMAMINRPVKIKMISLKNGNEHLSFSSLLILLFLIIFLFLFRVNLIYNKFSLQCFSYINKLKQLYLPFAHFVKFRKCQLCEVSRS